MAPVPVGRGLFGLRYENQTVRIDEPLLTDIARATGGRYFRARDAAALQAHHASRSTRSSGARCAARTYVALHRAVPLAARR